MKGFLFLLLFLSFNALGSTSYLEVSGVTVKMSANNSLSAKQKAISSSLNKAFGKLLQRYFPEAASANKTVSEAQKQKCVYDYSIDHEKFSGKIYIAQFSFRFKKNAVLQVLKDHNIKINEDTSQTQETFIVLHTQDYLDHYNTLSNYKVVLFSPIRILLKIPTELLHTLGKSRILFEKVDAKIYS